MTDTFQHRLGAAEDAAWWTVAVWWVLLTVFWLLSMVVVSYRPGWVMWMLGEAVTWEEYENMRLWFTATFKGLGCIGAAGALFLTLWRRGLESSPDA